MAWRLATTAAGLAAASGAMATQAARVKDAPAPMIDAQAAADIANRIAQQVQPCANRQIKAGPGAERIRVTLHIRLNRDGSLIGDPEVIGYDGVDDDNRRYLDRVKNDAIATFKDCAPIHDLPQQYYDLPRGWSDLKMRYRLPG